MTGTKIIKLRLDDGGVADRLPQLKDNALDEVVEKAVGLFERTEMPREWEEGFSPGWSEEPWNYKKIILEEGKKLDVTPSQLQLILTSLESRFPDEEGFGERLGIFLTALIEGSTHEEFTLRPTTLLSDFGYQLEADKNITVEGDVGDNNFYRVKKAKIHVKGNAGDEIGHDLDGGHILIDGDCGEGCGRRMKKGKIEVGGKIENTYGCARYGGQVWEKGKKVYPL
ncbi:MAG: hypothetical protein V1921_06255 [Candidatus Altiarchaeota archaeon]